MFRFQLPLVLVLSACSGTGDPIGGPDTGGGGEDGDSSGDDDGGESGGEEGSDSSGEEGGDEGGEDGGSDTGGGSDEPLQSLMDADAVLWGDAAGDFAGATVAFVGDVTGDGEGDILVGVPADQKGGTAAGGVVLVPGPLSGESTLSDAGFVLSGTSTETAGLATARLGDRDGDGLDDFAVGAPYSAGGGVQRGAVYIFEEGVDADGSLSDASVILTGVSNYALGGWSLDSGGDVDGDGVDDLVIGAKWQSTGMELYAGAAYVFTELPSDQGDLRDAEYHLQGEAEEDIVGQSVAIVDDVDGDGRADVLVGGVWISPDGDREHAGGAYLVTSSALESGSPGPSSLGNATAHFLGENEGDLAGWDVASAGDVNGDGFGDLLISAPAHTEVVGYDEAGATYLVFGPVEGTVELSDADARIIGDELLEWSGASVTGAGDQDGDGLDDVVIGSIYRSPGDAYIAGGVTLFTGISSGDTFLQDAVRTYAGTGEYDVAGWDVDSGFDMNGDGVPDLLVGASGSDRDGDSEVGSVHVIYGPLVSD